MSTTPEPQLDERTRLMREFSAEGDWMQFHDPKSLILALVGQVGELGVDVMVAARAKQASATPTGAFVRRQRRSRGGADGLHYAPCHGPSGRAAWRRPRASTRGRAAPKEDHLVSLAAPPPVSPAPAAGSPTVPDYAALIIGVVLLPIVGVLLKAIVPGWMFFMMLLASPILIGMWVLAIVLFRSIFGVRSRVRAMLGVVPPRYHVLAWAFGTALLLPGFVVLDGNDADPWTSPLLELMGRTESDTGWYYDFQYGVIAVVVLVVVGSLLAALLLALRDRRPPTPTSRPVTLPR